MRPIPLIMSAIALATQPAFAAPFCDALGDPEAIGKDYQRLAPIYSDDGTGWIFASDQLREDYALKDSAVLLLTQIVDDVRAGGADLAILVAPPRPLVADATAAAATLPGAAEFDAVKAASTFHHMISQFNEAGAHAPDLLRMVEDRPDLAARYYFARDTHWTHEGAAESAAALSRTLTEAGLPGLNRADLPGEFSPSPDQTYEQEGSLAEVVAQVCGIALSPETVRTIDFPSLSEETSLLDDAPAGAGPRIALLGTSFSNRYKRDEYRVADAIAHATGLEVDNYSVSGGGALSAIESYVLSGALDEGAHDILIWEVPYTSAFRSVSGLRQLLGALRANASRQTLAKAPLQETGQTRLKIPAGTAGSFLIEVASAKSGAKKLRGKVLYDNGSSTKVTFYRSARMPQAERDAPMHMSIDGSAKRRPVAIEITSDPSNTPGSTLSVHALN